MTTVWAPPPWIAQGPVPEAEPTSRRYVRPTKLAILLLALGALATLIWLIDEAPARMAISLGVLTAVIADALLARSALKNAVIDLQPEGNAVAGEPTRWRVTTGELRRPVTVCAAMYPRPGRVLVEPGSTGIVSLPPSSRGVVHYVIIDVYVTGPIGLFEAGQRFRVTPREKLYVGPRPLPVETRWPTPKAVGFGLSEMAPRGDDLFRGVRPYIRGDERRRIHWKATARTGELMVRESDGTGVVALQVVADLRGDVYRAEYGAAMAAWVAETALAHGWLVQLVTMEQEAVPPTLGALGSPFGPVPVPTHHPPPAPVSRADRVRSYDDVHRQLATAAPGLPLAGRWSGLTAVVSAEGVDWS